MTNITDEQIRKHLAKTGRIAIIWGIEDVKTVRPDLTDEQCEEVLHQCDHKHDANMGITWDVIACHASWLFPEPDDIDAQS